MKFKLMVPLLYLFARCVSKADGEESEKSGVQCCQKSTQYEIDIRYSDCNSTALRFQTCFVCRNEQYSSRGCRVMHNQLKNGHASGLNYKNIPRLANTIKNGGCYVYNFSYGSVSPYSLKGRICFCNSDLCNRYNLLQPTQSTDDFGPRSMGRPWNQTLVIVICVAGSVILLAFFCICWHQHGHC